MRVIAFTYVYNELDILPWTLRRLLDQGVDAWVLDNWSTDGTWEWLMQETGRWQGRLNVERFPGDRAPQWFDLDQINGRIEQLSRQLGSRYDWRAIFGADEVLESPWPGVALPQALARASAAGATVVDWRTATFHPIDDGWTADADPVQYFQHWTPGRLVNERAWMAAAVKLLDGGHRVTTEPHVIYGETFIIRHYPFRTQAQSERKVFVDRRPRYAPHNRRRGWHTHLDPIQPGHRFIQDPAGLREYDPETFYSEVQRCPTC